MNCRKRINVTGVVQGVGFRPFVYRHATALHLKGFVYNSCGGVTIEIQGSSVSADSFTSLLQKEAPPLARIDSISIENVALISAESTFSIISSREGEPLVQLPPDSTVCTSCLKELFDPSDRRYKHPFITCTDCGPRFSIIENIPYDRSSTTMKVFPLCPRCLDEYENPLSRRFHAEPLCCHDCGPQLHLVDSTGTLVSETPVESAAEIIKSGGIVAVKGAGGFHLAVDACSDTAVKLLRERKKRKTKPFALMAERIEHLREISETDLLSERLLLSDQKPIVLLRRNKSNLLSTHIAFESNWLGVMLPSTPIHYLLFHTGIKYMVMTSGNRSDEPIAASNEEALENLKGVADAFLLHDRAIVNRSDDSVMRVFRGNPLFYRRSRGFVPASLPLPFETEPLLAVGAELKGTVCVTRKDSAFPGQHLGDVSTENGAVFLQESAASLENLLKVKPAYVIHDSHPDFISTRIAEETALPSISVQHHHAHFAACLGENREYGNAIGIIFDGTGMGEDGTVWGGEFFSGGISGFKRFARFRQVCMPGGDKAAVEPWRMAASWLYESFGKGLQISSILSDQRLCDDFELIIQMIERRINSPLTSSCGRLFDAVSAILGLRYFTTFEGEAAIAVESAAEDGNCMELFPYDIDQKGDLLEIDFRPTVIDIVNAINSGLNRSDIALSFHHTVAQASLELCMRERERSKVSTVALSGGVFQNRLLTELLSERLEHEEFKVMTHRLLPPNDGCISYGQAVYANNYLKRSR